MALRSVETRRSQLQAIFSRVSGTQNDTELQAHFAKYLCVLVSGYVEQSVRDILADHAERTASGRVSRFVDRTVNRQNVNASVLLMMIENFDADWKARLGDFIDGERRAALDSIVTNRHAIAHGRPSSISFVQLSEYYKRIEEILKFIEDLAR